MYPVIVKGLLLGWSVAWPPGPINAEMIRRGLARGFWPAWAVGMGACTGDFMWALAVALGAGAVTRIPGVALTMGVVSTLLLFALAFVFLRGAWRGYRAHRRGEPLPEPKSLSSSRGGFLLGLSIVLTSPWNLAFWLAVIGPQGGSALPLPQALVLASSVVAGACAWGLVLCAALRLGARFATPTWSIATQALTGCLMLFFAIRAVLRLTEHA